MKKLDINLGIIEGFYGTPWSFEAREKYVEYLNSIGASFYIYCPKADQNLRKSWREDYSEEFFNQLLSFSNQCKKNSIQFGIGLSPYELFNSYDSKGEKELLKKIKYLDQLSPGILSILFDDMKGANDDTAKIQSDIIEAVVGTTKSENILMCPSYYSPDPVLDRVFGERPKNYLTDLGKHLNPKVDIYWTGPKICSTEYPIDHLKETIDQIGRKPFIWDNYPVNDGPRMCKKLHMRPFTGRPYDMGEYVKGLAINPMNEAYLSQIVIHTLFTNFAKKGSYNPDQAMRDSLKLFCNDSNLERLILENIPLFQDQGLDNIDATANLELVKKFQQFQQPAAQEIVAWLRGEYIVGEECLTN
jgi:hypothetical protein